MKQKTAIEWLIRVLELESFENINLYSMTAIEQAKEMHKQQSIELLTKYHDGLFYVPFKDGEAEAIYNHLTQSNESKTNI